MLPVQKPFTRLNHCTKSKKSSKSDIALGGHCSHVVIREIIIYIFVAEKLIHPNRPTLRTFSLAADGRWLGGAIIFASVCV